MLLQFYVTLKCSFFLCIKSAHSPSLLSFCCSTTLHVNLSLSLYIWLVLFEIQFRFYIANKEDNVEATYWRFYTKILHFEIEFSYFVKWNISIIYVFYALVTSLYAAFINRWFFIMTICVKTHKGPFDYHLKIIERTSLMQRECNVMSHYFSKFHKNVTCSRISLCLCIFN